MIKLAVSRQPFRQKNEWRLINAYTSTETAQLFEAGTAAGFANLSVNGFDALAMFLSSTNPAWENWRFNFSFSTVLGFTGINPFHFLPVRLNQPVRAIVMSCGELGGVIRFNVTGNPVATRAYIVFGIPNHNRRV